MLALLRFISTRLRVLSLRLRGCDIIVGRRSVISPRANIVPTGKIRIGDNCSISAWAVLNPHGGSITIGNNCSIQYHAVLYGHGGLSLGDNVRIAAQVVIVPSDHVYQDRSKLIVKQGFTAVGVSIEDDVWIGAGARILDGTRISTGAVIGAGSVIRGAIESYSVYAGIPGRKIKERT